jgi:hypothetical protein
VVPPVGTVGGSGAVNVVVAGLVGLTVAVRGGSGFGSGVRCAMAI